MRALVCDGYQGVGIHNLLLTEAPSVPWNPYRRCSGGDARLKVRIILLLLRVLDFHVVAGYLAPNGGVITIEVGVKPSPYGLPFACEVQMRETRVKRCGRYGGLFFGELSGFFHVESAGKEGVQRSKGFIEGHVGENGEDQVDYHDDQGPNGAFDGEETDQADVCQVEAGHQVLEGPGVDETLGVDAKIVDKEKVVSVGLVDKVETDECESEN